MAHTTLSLESSDDGRQQGRLWLIARNAQAGLEASEPIFTGGRFDVADVREALLATPWVYLRGEDLLLSSDASHREICEVIEEMLSYFDAPNKPRAKLLKVQQAASRSSALQKLGDALSWYSYAWLDVTVREDIAEQARSNSEVWSQRTMEMDVASCRQRRIAQIAASYTQPISATSRMAGSMATRPSQRRRGTGAG